MANTYTSLHYHFLFSTKNREPWLTPDIEPRILIFIGGISRAHKISALQVGGIASHTRFERDLREPDLLPLETRRGDLDIGHRACERAGRA